MHRRSKQKSCFACVASKRGCDKELPICSRCEEKEIACEYPAVRHRRGKQLPKSSQASVANDGPRADEHSITANQLATTDERGDIHFLGMDGNNSTTQLHNPQSCSTFTGTNLPSHASFLPVFPSQNGLDTDPSSANRLLPPYDGLKFFLLPSAWTIAYHYEPPAAYPPGEVLLNFTRGIQSWLKRFLRQGHNPFIHRHLYSNTTMPLCMQDAFASISIHQNAIASNEHIIDDIFASQVGDLVTKQPIEGSEAFTLLSTRDHIARTQALLIQLLLALFSSSIPRRAKAECLIATLHHWTNQLWQSASQDANFHTVVQSIPSVDDVGSGSIEDPVPGLYQSFVLYESARRTWILSNFATGVYQSLRGDWGTTCTGDICITARAELWDASSPARWAAIAQSKDPLFIYSLHGQSLLKDSVAAEEVDEFMRHLYTIMWGIDKVEDWIVRSGDAVSTMY
ncbi:hypothetical protein TGAM01_v206026 [Trichoderma gamsii]|uniref:Zn(2)-C6 fungal-type domain-containing protein n=1 Tax=Trichoderma gamsii TaxID=398673 RepID=A0A2P4ZL27_9HYPO|nr:hypothetical protein TGAM01_v206026 [Trichoderma gamsii]PON24945.1 hypothetical protein TGAM01_v206026 [Trichoderma gamsii]